MLLLTLTTAHAVLMVSAAIVISVQSTSVRAANLLASFVVIPVAILMQGESVLLFWGTDQVLWLAVAAVIIMAGVADPAWVGAFSPRVPARPRIQFAEPALDGRTFWKAFRGERRSPSTGTHPTVRQVP